MDPSRPALIPGFVEISLLVPLFAGHSKKWRIDDCHWLVDLLAVSVPRRGLMFVAAIERADKRELLILQAATRHEAKTTRAVSEAILLVRDGEVAGHVVISAGPGPARTAAADANAASDDAADHAQMPAADVDDAPPAKKPSWLRRLFGRKK